MYLVNRFILVLAALQSTEFLIQGAQLNCQWQWKNHDWCMKNQDDKYNPNKPLTEADRIEIKNAIQSCYSKQSCRNPFLSNAQSNVQSYCYRQTRNSLRQQILLCFNSSFPDYSMPPENDVSNALGQDMLDIKASDCQPKDKVAFGLCLGRARGARGNNTAFKNVDYCDVRYGCYRRVNFQQQCFNRSLKVRDKLCECSQKLNLTVYITQYKGCMKLYRYQVKNESLDYNIIAIKHFAGTRYCVNYTDPCGGFNGQKKNVAPPVFSAAKTTPAPSSSPTASNAAAAANKSDDVTQNGGLDFGSLLTSGGMFPNPQDVLANAGFGQMTGPGGIDAANLLGQDFNTSSLFPGFDLSALFGGADLSSFFGGGGMDLSSLFGGFNMGGRGSTPTSTSVPLDTTQTATHVQQPTQ